LTGRLVRQLTKCRECGAPLDKLTLLKIQRETTQENRRALLRQRKEFEAKISKLKTDQKKTTAKIIQSNRQQISDMKRSSEDRSKQDRTLFEHEFARLKKSYQLSIMQIKESYSRQNVAYFNELKELVGACIEDGRKNYQSLVEQNQTHVQELQNWLQQELPHQLIELASSEADSETNSLSESDIHRLAHEISSRDEAIQRAEGRIKDLEDRLSSKQSRTIWNRMRRSTPTEPYKEDEPADPQQEVLNMIREIAREREQMESARQVSGERGRAQFADSFGSKMSKKLVH
jgi:hypothetical protein